MQIKEAQKNDAKKDANKDTKKPYLIRLFYLQSYNKKSKWFKRFKRLGSTKTDTELFKSNRLTI
jgi:hypothetical protein